MGDGRKVETGSGPFRVVRVATGTGWACVFEPLKTIVVQPTNDPEADYAKGAAIAHSRYGEALPMWDGTIEAEAPRKERCCGTVIEFELHHGRRRLLAI